MTFRSMSHGHLLFSPAPPLHHTPPGTLSCRNTESGLGGLGEPASGRLQETVAEKGVEPDSGLGATPCCVTVGIHCTSLGSAQGPSPSGLSVSLCHHLGVLLGSFSLPLSLLLRLTHWAYGGWGREELGELGPGQVT